MCRKINYRPKRECPFDSYTREVALCPIFVFELVPKGSQLLEFVSPDSIIHCSALESLLYSAVHTHTCNVLAANKCSIVMSVQNVCLLHEQLNTNQ
jgi:hypothetical protein